MEGTTNEIEKNVGRILSIALLLAVLFGAIFCSKTPKNNQFPYIPQDYYPVKIEYIDAPDEIKFSTDLEWQIL